MIISHTMLKSVQPSHMIAERLLLISLRSLGIFIAESSRHTWQMLRFSCLVKRSHYTVIPSPPYRQLESPLPHKAGRNIPGLRHAEECARECVKK